MRDKRNCIYPGVGSNTFDWTMKYYASKSRRALEAIIDHSIMITFTIAYIYLFGEPNEEGVLSVQGIMTLPAILFWLLYFPLLESSTGQTLGKMILGIRVATLSGGQISFLQSVVRRLFDFVDLMFFGLVAVLVINSNEDRQRVGDLVAKTTVVKNHYGLCQKCKVEVILNKEEAKMFRFTCPECGNENWM